MTKRAPEAKNGFEQIPFRMHPRVFAALGADLVTNDVVAVIELVKNSYDAFAQSVRLRFRDDPSHGMFLEIEDDGNGMTREVLEDVWCLVATPHKEVNPVVKERWQRTSCYRRKRPWPSFRCSARGAPSHADTSTGEALLGGKRQLVRYFSRRRPVEKFRRMQKISRGIAVRKIRYEARHL